MFVPKNEMGVIVRFAQQARELGIEIIDIGAAFPDMTIMYQGVTYRVEAEYKSSNFVSHGHDPLGCDAILCWLDDMEVAPVPAICLSDTEWHTKPWHTMTSKDKEIQRLHAEIRRLKDLVSDGNLLDAGRECANENKRNQRQENLEKLVDLLSSITDPDAINKADIARQLGVSRQTVVSYFDTLEQSGRIHINGAVKVN